MGQTTSTLSGREESVRRGQETQSESWQSKTRQFESKIVAAIDFGTSYTGFAYAFKGDINEIVTGIQGHILADHRVPTVVLLKPNGDFDSFGIDAEDNYADLTITKEHHEYRLFRQFKMALYNQEATLNSDITINDTEGRPKKAVDVFSIVIARLKKLILNSMTQSKVGDRSIFESKTQWVLTIPAIWSDSARQFMREAAIQGGIPEKNLRLVLEPEAAALFCKNQLLEATNNAKLTKLPTGVKYILADLGGGTADICSHEILENEKVRELFSAEGGPYGGLSVDNNFIQFLVKLCGGYILKNFKKNKMREYLRIQREFEKSKKKFDYQQAIKLVIDVPQSLVTLIENDTKCTFEEVVANSPLSECVTVIENCLLCDVKTIENFFKSSVEGILMKLREIISHCEKDEINILLLVGGYAESPYVRGIIQKEFDQMKVVLVHEPSLAVLKGAVFMGFAPRDIIERRARYTYGFSIAKPFKEGTHPESLKFTRDGNTYCNHIFDRVIEKNQILTYNQEFKVNTSTELRHPDSKRLKLSTSLYRTDKREPEYCLRTENCLQVAEISLEPPVDGWPDNLDMDDILIVGETEFTVKAIDKSSGREFKTCVDFLSINP